MRHTLWIANSSLLGILFAVLAINMLLYIDIAQLKKVRMPPFEFPEEKAPILLKVEKIFQNDLFDTYTPPAEIAPPTLLPPIADPKRPEPKKLPPPKKPELLPPLEIKLKGIMFSSEQSKSIALLEDETGKEVSYHFGEKVKEAQVVRIAKDRIILLRTNGQQETLFLRKDEIPLPKGKDRWKKIVQKIDDTTYHVNPNNFRKEIGSLGQLLETLAAATAYEKKKPIGVRIGTIGENDIGGALGLQTNDIIFAINNIEVTMVEGRMKAYDSIIKLKLNDKIVVKLKRAAQEQTMTYQLKPLLAVKIPPFGTGPLPKEKVKKAGLFKLNKQQKYEKRLRQFKKHHRSPNRRILQEQTHKQLLEKMRRRRHNARTRK